MWIAGLCVIAGLLACAAPASAARPRGFKKTRPHEFKESFGTKCLAEPCEEGRLKAPAGVGVNEASGDIYVVDQGEGGQHGRVVRFSEAGVFQSELTGPNASGTGTLSSGSSTIEAPLASIGAFSVGEEISAPGLEAGTTITAVTGGGTPSLEISQPATKSELASLTAQQHFETPETIAVDNSCVLRKVSEPELKQATCEGEDPSDGDVYVVDLGSVAKHHLLIDKFSAAGEYLGQITEGNGGRFSRRIDGVAVDRAGHVWVLQETQVINEYSDAVENAFMGVIEYQSFAKFPAPVPGSLAVDSKGNFYLVHGPGESTAGTPGKISSSGAILSEELDSEPASSVAVDQLTNFAFVDNLTTIAAFDPEGKLIERLGREEGLKHLSEGAGIGVNASSGFLYVADAATGTVVVFGPAQPSVPKVEGESFSKVSSNSASLAASINPSSEAGEGPTEYRFQYGRCTSASACPSSGYEASAPEPPGQIAADFEVHEVGVEIANLQPNSTYHFRVLAKNSHGEGQPGKDVTFTTEGAGGELTLPDNRGWELVSPPQKLGALIEPISEVGVVQAAASGSAIAYQAQTPTETEPQGASGKTQVLSRRGESSWSSRDIAIPHESAGGLPISAGQEYRFFDQELGLSAVQPSGQFDAPLSEEASESTAYLHSLSESCAGHCYRPLVTGKPGFANVAEGTQFGEEENCMPNNGHAQAVCGPRFVGASADLSHVVVHATAALKAGAGPNGLYEWSAGALSQVNILPGPGEEAAPGGALGFHEGHAARGAISSDGTRIVWELNGASLYLRDMSLGETVQLDKAQTGCGACESGGGKFQIASANGSRVYFTSEERLSEDSGAEPNKADLYECQIVVSGEELGCNLTDLTPANGGESAAVQGGILGASEDGSYIYFVAKGVLSKVANSRGQSAASGQANLYVAHNGATSFIATLAGGDEHDWETELAHQPTRVSPKGQWLELMSGASLTGYDNRDVATGKPVAEVYTYDAATGRLSCASCEPSGERPTGVEYKKLEPERGGLVGGPADIWPETALVGANVPGWTQIPVGVSRYQPRYLNNEGRLFFNSIGALVPQDSNATQDVYEYEPPGVGSCSEESPTFSARSGGCVNLISSGSSAQESAFLDASESGDDVFFLTSAVLSPLDTDTARDVYDAHICTSSSPCITFPDVQSPPCTTEASCKAAPSPQPSIFGSPASATFQGPGNPPPPHPAPAKVKTPEELRIEHLKKALKSCHAKKRKAKRKACEKQARKRYAKPKAKAKAKAKAKKQSSSKRKGKR